MNLYKEKEREQMLEEDEITAAESFYGWERNESRKKEERSHARKERHGVG